MGGGGSCRQPASQPSPHSFSTQQRLVDREEPTGSATEGKAPGRLQEARRPPQRGSRLPANATPEPRLQEAAGGEEEEGSGQKEKCPPPGANHHLPRRHLVSGGPCGEGNWPGGGGFPGTLEGHSSFLLLGGGGLQPKSTWRAEQGAG